MHRASLVEGFGIENAGWTDAHKRKTGAYRPYHRSFRRKVNRIRRRPFSGGQ
jgi:hypothetical protein